MAAPGYQQGGYPPNQGAYPPQGGYQQQQPPTQPQGGYQQQQPPAQLQGGYQQQQPPEQQQEYQPAPSQLPPQGQGQGQPQAPPPENVPEDVGEERAPSPPPLSDMDRVQGYENVNFQADAFIPPPAYEPSAPDHAHSPPVQADIPTISEDNARDALMREVNDHCCYGKKAAEDLIFTNMIPSSAFHYQLETFTEGRKTAWAFDPYSGQPVDGPQNGPAPGPWDISAQPGKMFENHVKVFEVPHTASLKVCHGCLGVGMNQCKRCLGCGQVTCNACSGSGRTLQPHIHHDHHHGHHHHGHHNHHHGHHNHHHGGTHVDVESVRCMSCHGSGRKM